MNRRDELPIYWRDETPDIGTFTDFSVTYAGIPHDDFCDCDERSAPSGVALGVLVGGMLWVVALVAVAKACGI